MDEAVPNHFVLAFEPLAAFCARTSFDRAVVRSCRGVDVCVRVEKVLCLEGGSGAACKCTYIASDLGVGDTINAHAVRYRG